MTDMPPQPPSSMPAGLGRDGVTRSELAAHLAAIEARIDARVTRIEAKLDLAMESNRVISQAALTMAGEAKQAALEARRAVLEVAANVSASLREQRYWVAGIGATVVIGMWAVNQAHLGNMFTAFESGRDAGATLARIVEQQQVIADQQRVLANRIEGLGARLAASSPAPGASRPHEYQRP